MEFIASLSYKSLLIVAAFIACLSIFIFIFASKEGLRTSDGSKAPSSVSPGSRMLLFALAGLLFFCASFTSFVSYVNFYIYKDQVSAIEQCMAKSKNKSQKEGCLKIIGKLSFEDKVDLMLLSIQKG